MKNNTKKTKKPVVLLVALLVLVATGVIVLTGCGGSGEATSSEPQTVINPITGEECPDGLPARPVQVSIPNAPDGAVPQSNISYADIIYEMPVEGELTRLQAIFYSSFPDKVGPVRSVRYYFVDLAREYNAFHVGYGWGKKAHSYMSSTGLPYINGMQDTDLFYRVEDKAAPNNAYINWSDIASYGGYDREQTVKAWKFRDDEWEAEKANAKSVIEEKSGSDDPEDVQAVAEAKLLVEPETAKSVSVKSTGCNSTCTYNEETGLYERTWYGEPYVDKETGEQLTFANVLVQYVESIPMTDDETGELDAKGRLEIDLNSSGDAILFTQGEMIKGTWSKKDPDGRTIFRDENGNQFRFAKGKTWVYVVDENLECTYDQGTATEETTADETAE